MSLPVMRRELYLVSLGFEATTTDAVIREAIDHHRNKVVALERFLAEHAPAIEAMREQPVHTREDSYCTGGSWCDGNCADCRLSEDNALVAYYGGNPEGPEYP